MKASTIVRNLVAVGLSGILVSQAMARVVTAAPGSNLACFNPDQVTGKAAQDQATIPVTNPDDVRKMLIDLKANLGEERMLQIFGRPALQSLSSYSQMDKRQIYMNAYLAAAATGAAVAVVDYVWDRYVGNGGKNKLGVPRDYFDQPDIMDRRRQPGLRPRDADPSALTPAIGSAVVGAVAYKAVEYSLRKTLGDATFERERLVNPREFDLAQGDSYRQY